MRYTGAFGKKRLSPRTAPGLELAGRNLLGQLENARRLGNIPFSRKWAFLDDGSVLEAIVDHGIYTLRMHSPTSVKEEEGNVSVSIESGLINMPWAGETANVPADLHPLDAQRTQAALVEDQLLDYMEEDYTFTYRDWYYGTDEFDSISLPAAAAKSWQDITYQARLYELTGKLHFAMQVKTRGLEFPTDDKGLYVDGFTSWVIGQRGQLSVPFPETQNNSYMLYTVELGTYYLIHYTGGSIKARLLRMSSKYKLALEEVQNRIEELGAVPGDAEYQRYEAYVLACLDFAGDWQLAGTYEIEGTPFAYGWKPSWAGTRASIATNESGGTDGYTLAYPHTARLYTTTITGGGMAYDGVNRMPVVATTALITEKVWTPRLEPGLGVQTDIVWQPDLLSPVRSKYWFPHSIFASYATLINVADVPIYCYYNHTNKLLIANYEYDDTAVVEEDKTITDWLDDWEIDGRSGCFPGGFDGEHSEIADGVLARYYFSETADNDEPPMYADPALLGDAFMAEVGEVTGSADKRVEKKYGGAESVCYQACTIVVDSTSVLCLHPSTASTNWCGSYRSSNPWFDGGDGCWTGSRPDRYAEVTWKYALMYKETGIGTVDVDCWPALLIPWGNAESVYLLGGTEVHGPWNLNKSYGRGVSTISGPGATYIHKFRSPKFHNYCQHGSGCTGISYTYPTDSTPIDNYTVKRVFADKFGVQTFDELTNSGSFPESTRGLFVVSLNDPYYVGWFWGIAGVEGPKYYQQHPGGNDFGDFNSNVGIEYSDTYFRAFAGWA